MTTTRIGSATRVLGVALILASLCGIACGGKDRISRRSELPELPQLDLGDFAPVVAADIQAAIDAVAADPESPSVNGQLAMLLHANRKWKEAVGVYQRVQVLEPEHFRWHYYEGVAQQSLRDDGRAVAAFQRALQILPGERAARLRLAESLFRTGDFDRSRESYELYLQEVSGAPRALVGLGQIAAGQQDWDIAIQHYRGALKASPHYGAAHLRLAEALAKTGDAEAAKTHLELHQQNADRRPAPPDPYLASLRRLSSDPRDLLLAGRVSLSRNRPRMALQHLERLLEVDPKSVNAHADLIRVLYLLGEPERAEAHYRTALRLNQTAWRAYLNYGHMMLEREKIRDAVPALREAVRFNPKSAPGHSLLGLALEQRGEEAEAIRCYRRALEHKPMNHRARSHLGRLLIARGRDEEGIKLLTGLKGGGEEKARINMSLAAAYERRGEVDKAVAHLRQARLNARAAGGAELRSQIDRRLRALGVKTEPGG